MNTTPNPSSLFKKAELLLADAQKVPHDQWTAERGNRSTTLDISKYVSSHTEAHLLGHVVTVILQSMPTAGTCCSCDISEKNDHTYGTLRIASGMQKGNTNDHTPSSQEQDQYLSTFLNDNSLRLPTQPRDFTAQYIPNNTREAIDFVRWKESTRFKGGKGERGYYLAFPASHGSGRDDLFAHQLSDPFARGINEYFREIANQTTQPLLPPKDWIFPTGNPEKTRFPDTRPTPQIYNDDWSQMLVLHSDAQNILVDLIGLDEKILGLPQQRRK